MPTADTSWLLRLFNKDEPGHAEARERSRGLTNVLVPSLVLAEVLQVTEFETRRKAGAKAGREAAREVYRALRTNPAFTILSEVDLDLADRIFTGNSKLSYVDAAGAAVAYAHESDLLTFDEDQMKAFKALT